MLDPALLGFVERHYQNASEYLKSILLITVATFRFESYKKQYIQVEEEQEEEKEEEPEDPEEEERVES